MVTCLSGSIYHHIERCLLLREHCIDFLWYCHCIQRLEHLDYHAFFLLLVVYQSNFPGNLVNMSHLKHMTLHLLSINTLWLQQTN